MVSRLKLLYYRWTRSYSTIFLIGLLIFLTQILLALKFISLNSDIPQNVWNPHRISKPEEQTRTLSKDLDFTLPCEIKTKEALSAIHRAKTQKCKQEISNITCLINDGLLYPNYLPNYCSDGATQMGRSLGCFQDKKSFRLLNGFYGNEKKLNSPDYCVKLCLQSGFVYAGVQYSTECFCGNDEPSLTAKLPDSSCNMKCPSDPHLACGGYFTINIYQTGIRKNTSQLPVNLGFTDTEPARIVFLLTLNGRALRQVHRLIKILYQKHHYYYIHVDVRQDYLFRELTHLEKQYPNIRLTRKRFATIWGGASLLTMLLSTMKELLSLDWQWDFVLNLSESDYPVKTVTRLQEFLTANKNRNFVKSHGQDVQRFIQKQGLDKTFVECEARMWRVSDRKLPWGIQIDGGSDWVALSRTFVAYVTVDEPDELVRGLLVVFRYTLLPAESFFHTVLRNSRFCDTYVDNNLHVTNWKRRLGCKCQYKHVVDWCGCSPNDFKPEDWPKIQSTELRQLFFARKFEPIVNQAVILRLERWLYGAEFRSGVVNLESYWQSVYNYLDLGEKDDVMLTFTSGALRVHAGLFADDCDLKPVKIREVTTFLKNDAYQQTLVSYIGNYTNNQKITLEFGLKPLQSFTRLWLSEVTQRLEYLKVSTDYDQKEQMLRNFAQIMGPYSEPVLVYNFSTSLGADASNVTFLWLDPFGRLTDVTTTTIDETTTIGHTKLASKHPHLPGPWTVKMLHEDEIVAELTFLISPLEYYGGLVATQTQLQHINSGTEPDVESTLYEEFLPKPSSSPIANPKLDRKKLQESVDGFLRRFYEIQGSCVVGDARNVCGVELQACGDTEWSSYAADPKSEMGKGVEEFEERGR